MTDGYTIACEPLNQTLDGSYLPGRAAAQRKMIMRESLDTTYEHLPPHIRKVAVQIAQQIALTAEPVKTTLEATFTEFLGQILLHVKEWK